MSSSGRDAKPDAQKEDDESDAKSGSARLASHVVAGQTIATSENNQRYSHLIEASKFLLLYLV
jgi:hypothetical protein